MRTLTMLLLLTCGGTFSGIVAHKGGGGGGGGGDHDHGHHHHGDRCWVDHVSHVEMARDEAKMKRIEKTEAGRRRLQKLSCNELCDGCIVIDTYFHLMVFVVDGTQLPGHPTPSMERLLDGDPTLDFDDFSTVDDIIEIIRNNVAYTNSQLAGTPFRLNFIDNDVSLRQERDYLYNPMSFRIPMTEEIGKADLKVLDVYLSYTLNFEGETNPPLRVGTSSLPSQQLLQKSDGIFMRYDTLTNGGLDPIDDGVTLTHELGHWLGLYHTFLTEDFSASCEASPNDFIVDTPAHAGDSSGFDCTQMLTVDNQIIESALPDTCPSLDGADPVFNFMNYVTTDECHTRAGSFSCNQIERMYYQWILYRDDISTCPDGQFELEFTLKFDDDHDRDNRIVIYKNRGTANEEIIFDTDVDHDDGAFQLQDVLAVDLCVPASSEYVFELTDSNGDGFVAVDAEASIFQDTVLLDTVSGNFGSVYSLVIPASETTAPSNSPSVSPTVSPTAYPSTYPSTYPTEEPSATLSSDPTEAGTAEPTSSPTFLPTSNFDTRSPTVSPTSPPTRAVTSPAPTGVPTIVPTRGPNNSLDSIADIVEKDPNLTFLETALDALGLLDALSVGGPFVLLAPTDQAFQDFAQLFQALSTVILDPEWIAHLRELVTFHASLERFAITNLGDGVFQFTMLSGEDIQLTVAGDNVTITPAVDSTPAGLLISDIEATNGLVSIIDSVLQPEYLLSDLSQFTSSNFPNFFALLVDAGLDDFILNNFGLTIFAPNDSLLANVNLRRLQFRRKDVYTILAAQIVTSVVPTEFIPPGFSTLQSLAGTTLRLVKRDGSITVNGFPLRQTDILVSDGILHTVDHLFLETNAPAPTPKGRQKHSAKRSMKKKKSSKGKSSKGKSSKGKSSQGKKPAPKRKPQPWKKDKGKYKKPGTPGKANISMWMSKQKYRKPAWKPQNVFMGKLGKM